MDLRAGGADVAVPEAELADRGPRGDERRRRHTNAAIPEPQRAQRGPPRPSLAQGLSLYGHLQGLFV